jgi:hypothetical protein
MLTTVDAQGFLAGLAVSFFSHTLALIAGVAALALVVSGPGTSTQLQLYCCGPVAAANRLCRGAQVSSTLGVDVGKLLRMPAPKRWGILELHRHDVIFKISFAASFTLASFAKF